MHLESIISGREPRFTWPLKVDGPPGGSSDEFTASRRLNGAGSRIRTRDILITNQALYQLSYTGDDAHLALHTHGGKVGFLAPA